MTRSTHKPSTQVADHRFQRIDGVDGVPTAHTQRGWVHAWTVSDGPESAAPCPFAAKSTVPAAVAVSAMCVVVLIATVASLVTVTDGQPNQSRIVFACLGVVAVFCVLWAMPALIRAAVRLPRARTDR